MPIEQELASIAPQTETILTIGVFDGVHVGHRFLLGRLQSQAAERSLLSVAITFDPHPQSVLNQHSQLPWLSATTERVRQLRELGVDLVAVLTFTPEVAQLSAREFISLLKKHLKMRGMMVGSDFMLGRQREGTIALLRKLGEELEFSVETVSPYTIDGEVVSSTLIRQALAEGDTGKVHKLMGRYFHIAGRVIESDKRGRVLGFPTANLEIRPQQALPADGIYATITWVGDKRFSSATSIGTRPTFGEGKKTVESYLLNYKGDLYGKQVQVEFVERLRDERRFPSPEELKAQIEKDVREVEAILSEDAR